MARETERKFLVRSDEWRPSATPKRYVQGYLTRGGGVSVRVRIVEDHACLTIKGESEGASRSEFEYDIPLDDARRILAEMCQSSIIEKTRSKVEHGDWTWEVDVFHGENDGLVMAEVELPHEDAEVELPDWVGQEVTHDGRFYNVYLAENPFSTWSDSPA